MTPDTPTPPAPSPPAAETLEQRLRAILIQHADCMCGNTDIHEGNDAYKAIEEAADALRRLHAAEQERDARAAEVEHWVNRYNELERWRIQTRERADAAEQRLREQETRDA